MGASRRWRILMVSCYSPKAILAMALERLTGGMTVLPSLIREKYNLGPYFYIDLWPIADPFLAVFEPDLAAQFTTDYSTPKFGAYLDFMVPLAGHGDMVSSSGPHWKKWRSIFNPGFAGGHLMTLVPGIVDQVAIFAEKLSELSSKQEPFRLEEIATR
jgi:cytochrome P450